MKLEFILLVVSVNASFSRTFTSNHLIPANSTQRENRCKEQSFSIHETLSSSIYSFISNILKLQLSKSQFSVANTSVSVNDLQFFHYSPSCDSIAPAAIA
jgi:hypothetical protein